MQMRFFGPKVVITPVTEKHEGLVVVPPGAGRHNYILGTVTHLGDGKTTGSDKVFESDLKVGDNVLVQTNDYMVQACTFKEEGKLCMAVNEGDVIAKLTSLTIKLDTFNVVGHWVLLKPFTKFKSELVLPDTVKDDATSEFTRYTLVQLGSKAQIRPTVGNEVIMDKGRVMPIQIQNETYYYANENSMLGEVYEDRPSIGAVSDN